MRMMRSAYKHKQSLSSSDVRLKRIVLHEEHELVVLLKLRSRRLHNRDTLHSAVLRLSLPTLRLPTLEHHLHPLQSSKVEPSPSHETEG